MRGSGTITHALTNDVRSAEEHQNHLERHPEDCRCCHIPDAVLNKYRDR